MSGFRPRLEELADDALVVVRGGTLDVPTLRADAVKAKRRFGDYGVSVFGVPDRSALEELARVRLQRFEILTVTTAGAIRAAGLELRRPSAGRTTPSCCQTSIGISHGW